MKQLFLLRHAKPGQHDRQVRDFDRSLNERGRRGARLIGQWMKKQGFTFDHAIVSPAQRTKDTLGEIEAGYGSSLQAVDEKRVYLASSVTLLDVIRECDDAWDSVLLLGHNPGLEDLVLDLVPEDGDSPLRDVVYAKFPTCSIARLECDVAHWADLAEGKARLADFVRPRDLDSDLGPEE